MTHEISFEEARHFVQPVVAHCQKSLGKLKNEERNLSEEL